MKRWHYLKMRNAKRMINLTLSNPMKLREPPLLLGGGGGGGFGAVPRTFG